MKLLTEPEVAEVLRCDPQKVKRLRLSGQLAYLPGRPVLIDEADLIAFIEDSKRRGVGDQRQPSTRDEEKRAVETADDARKWALEQITKRPDGSREEAC